MAHLFGIESISHKFLQKEAGVNPSVVFGKFTNPALKRVMSIEDHTDDPSKHINGVANFHTVPHSGCDKDGGCKSDLPSPLDIVQFLVSSWSGTIVSVRYGVGATYVLTCSGIDNVKMSHSVEEMGGALVTIFESLTHLFKHITDGNFSKMKYIYLEHIIMLGVRVQELTDEYDPVFDIPPRVDATKNNTVDTGTAFSSVIASLSSRQETHALFS